MVVVDWTNNYAVKGLGYISGDDSVEYGAILVDPEFVLQDTLYQNADYLSIVSTMNSAMKFAPATLPTPPTITDINFGDVTANNGNGSGDDENNNNNNNNNNNSNTNNNNNTNNGSSTPETNAPETTPAPSTKKSGCGSVASLVLVPLLTLGAAVTVCKKKKD